MEALLKVLRDLVKNADEPIEMGEFHKEAAAKLGLTDAVVRKRWNALRDTLEEFDLPLEEHLRIIWATRSQPSRALKARAMRIGSWTINRNGTKLESFTLHCGRRLFGTAEKSSAAAKKSRGKKEDAGESSQALPIHKSLEKMEDAKEPENEVPMEFEIEMEPVAMVEVVVEPEVMVEMVHVETLAKKPEVEVSTGEDVMEVNAQSTEKIIETEEMDREIEEPVGKELVGNDEEKLEELVDVEKEESLETGGKKEDEVKEPLEETEKSEKTVSKENENMAKQPEDDEEQGTTSSTAAAAAAATVRSSNGSKPTKKSRKRKMQDDDDKQYVPPNRNHRASSEMRLRKRLREINYVSEESVEEKTEVNEKSSEEPVAMEPQGKEPGDQEEPEEPEEQQVVSIASNEDLEPGALILGQSLPGNPNLRVGFTEEVVTEEVVSFYWNYGVNTDGDAAMEDEEFEW